MLKNGLRRSSVAYLAGLGMVMFAGGLYRFTRAVYMPRRMMISTTAQENGNRGKICDCGPLWACLTNPEMESCDDLERELKECMAQDLLD